MSDNTVAIPANFFIPDCPPLLLMGLDSLYVGYFVDVVESQLDPLELEYQKLRLRDQRSNQFKEIELGSERFALLPNGSFPYAWVLSNKAFTVRLAERMQPSVHVQFHSEALWHEGLDGLEQRLRTWFDSLNLVAKREEAVSRADWAFDFHLSVIDFEMSHFVSRATKDMTYRGHGLYQTFNLGLTNVVVRVYDKVAEVREASGKYWFYDLWDRKNEVWRIEFQVRGERLKKGGIRTLADLRDLQNDLLRELASKHTTLRRPSGDSNRSRWPLHPLWRALQAEIDKLPQTGLVHAYDPVASLEYRLHQQGKSMLGNLKGLAALMSVGRGKTDPLPVEMIIASLRRIVSPHYQHDIWEEDVMRRMKGLELGKW